MAKPEIRLKGFEGEWELSLMSELTTSFSYGINAAAIQYDGIHKYLRITDINDSSNEFDQSNLTSPNAEESKLAPFYLKEGDITFARTGASVGKSYIYNPNDGNVIFAGFLIRVILKDRVNPFFVYLNTLTKKYRKHVTLVSQRSGQPGMNPKEFGEFRFYISPNSKEQRAIGDYFKSLNSTLQSTTKKIASLKQMKQACLVSMFPQAGETTPRVRFKGFEGKWGYSSLGEIFEERVESNIYGEMLSVTMNNGVIKASENGRFDNSNSDKSKYKVVKVNDIAYNSMRMWQGASGCSQYEGIVSPAYTVVVPCEGIDSLFFSYMFKTLPMITLFRLHSQGLTSDTWNLKYPAFSKIKVIYPKEIQEQQRIASYFRSLDKQISLQEKRLEKLKQIKAACLDKMFV